MENHYFEISTLPLYCVGFLTFLCTLLDDWLNPQRQFKKIPYYIQEFLYSFISIALGISICLAFETSQSVSWIVSIIMGLCGASIIRTIRNKREDIGQSVVDKIKDTIKNPGKLGRNNGNKSVNDNVLNSQRRGDIPYKSYNDVCNDEQPYGEHIEQEETSEEAEQRMREKFNSINNKNKKI